MILRNCLPENFIIYDEKHESHHCISQMKSGTWFVVAAVVKQQITKSQTSFISLQTNWWKIFTILVKDSKRDENEIVNGTYLHPKLLLALVIWLLPKAYIMTATIVKDFVIHVHKWLIYDLKVKHSMLMGEKELQDELEKCTNKLDLETYYNQCLNIEVVEFQDMLKQREAKLIQKSAEFEEKPVAVKKCHCFHLMHKHLDGVKFNYTTLCVQKKGLNKSMKWLRKKFPKLEIVLDLPYHPKAQLMNKWIKEALKKCVDYHFNDVVSYIDEHELVNKITVI